jgi:hypothetical protein
VTTHWKQEWNSEVRRESIAMPQRQKRKKTGIK